MKKKIAMLGTTLLLISQGVIYPQTFAVTKVNADTFELTTYSGHVWEEPNPEDWMEGDIAAAIMFNNFTPDITDDPILVLRYTGNIN